MGAGKYLAIIAALSTILGSYVFAMFSGTAPGSVASSIAIFQGLEQTFNSADIYGSALGGTWVVYILIILLILFALSGFVQIIGIKSRAGIFIFSLFPLIIGIVMFLALNNSIDNSHVNYMMTVVSDPPIIEDVFPYLVNIGDAGLGLYFVIAGGVIGIISGLLPREESY